MSLRLKLAAALGAAILVLLVGGASFYFMEQSRRSSDAVDHTNEVRAQLERTLRTVVDAETGQRGYLLTGDSSYLQPYLTARTDVDHELAMLRQLTADNPVQHLRLDSLELTTAAKLVELNQTITLTAAQQRDSAVAVMLAGRGTAYTLSIRRLLGKMETTELALLAEHTADYQERQRIASLVIILGSIIAATLSALTVFSLRTGIVELEQAKSTIEHQNDNLLKANANAEHLIGALARSNQELDQFAYVASHDLKAPLRGIANLSQWVEEDLGENVPPDVSEKMNLLRGRVQRLEALIDGILQYSRAGRARASVERVDVGALIHDVIELLAPPPEISITVDQNMPTLTSERTPLQQVFMNLISNAIKYNRRPGATIHVSVHDAGRFDTFSVADNGPGIEPEYHDRIFGIFQTLQSRDKVEGTGIGLSVVKKIVELRGGTIRVDSAPGRGATFTFEWPKTAAGSDAA